MTRTTDDHAPVGASTPHALDADTARGAARLMRATRLLAVVMLVVLVVLVMTVAGGAPTSGMLPMIALLVAGLAAERVRARHVAIGQGRRLALVARQLRGANARLEASNEELMAFAGRIAHDLRSPLGTVVTTLDTVRRADLDLADDVREQLMEQAHRAATRSIDTVAALLDHASAEGRAPRCSLVDVRELIEEVLTTLPTAELGTRTVVPPDDPALVWGDPHLLRLVVQNLVQNALAHGGEQLARVHVVVQPGDQQVVVAVEDDGVGIPAEVREAVFTAGTRNSTTAGLGLGLATCASIVGRHDGRIWVEDSVLGGAAIRFSLPWPPERAALPHDVIDLPFAEPADQRLRATTSSSGSSSRTSSAPYRPGSAPATVSTSSPAR